MASYDIIFNIPKEDMKIQRGERKRVLMDSTVEKRKPYRRPRLVLLGDLRGITLGGSLGMGESGSPQSNKNPKVRGMAPFGLTDPTSAPVQNPFDIEP